MAVEGQPGPGRKRLLRWLGGWVVLAVVGLTSYNASYAWTSQALVHHLQIRPAAALIDLLLPGEVFVEGMSIRHKGVTMIVARGCDGVETLVILLSALLTYAMPWRNKVRALFAGTVFILALNYLRLVSMFFVVLWRPGWFYIAHDVVWQGGMILAAVFFVLATLKPLDEKQQG